MHETLPEIIMETGVVLRTDVAQRPHERLKACKEVGHVKCSSSIPLRDKFYQNVFLIPDIQKLVGFPAMKKFYE